MKNKMVTAAEAVSAIKDGDMVAVGGFLGTGSPEILMDALVAQGTKHLTVIANDGGLNEENAPTNGKLKGIAKLLANHQIDHLIASHIGVNPEINRQIAAGTLTYELFPQGSLAEKLRKKACSASRTSPSGHHTRRLITQKVLDRPITTSSWSPVLPRNLLLFSR